MKRQHRWSTESEILKAIDQAHQLADSCMAAAHALKCSASECSRMVALKESEAEDAGIATPKGLALRREASGYAHEAEQNKEQAKKLEKQATRILDVKLPKLGRTLAAFRTIPFDPITQGDNAVVTS